MSNKHYDIAIIGNSLAARIAAALLAKRGSKVLFLCHSEATASAWFHSSIFLEKLLGILGGRSCFVTQQPIQVLSRNARVTLCNDVPLDRELSREFGKAGSAVSGWLDRLASQGDQLEKILWENGGLPWPSLKATSRFKLLCMRRKVSWSDLDAPVKTSMDQLPKSALVFVIDLLQGLSLKKIDELSRAQAALLWAQATRPENLKEPDFSELLSKRFDQFHGLKAALKNLSQLDFDGSCWTGGHLKDGGQFSANVFLLGDIRWIDRFAAGKTADLPAPPALTKYRTGSLSGQLSPLLASQVICGGDIPLRLAIEQNKEDHVYGLLASGGATNGQQLRRQLEPVLPFARYELVEDGIQVEEHPRQASAQQPQKLANLPLRIGTNLYCADNYGMLPEMGAAGAALLGWTLAENIVTSRKQGKE
jgi:hypothetical protein